MPKANLQEILPYNADHLLEMVTDVESYPEFINFISGLRITSPRKRDGDIETFEAQMNVSYKMFTESVRCTVTINHAKKTVVVRNSDRPGPIKTLINDWTFTQLSDGSTVIDFFVDVTLKSFPLNMIASQKFGSVSEKMMAVFVRRAGHKLRKVKPDDKIDLVAEFKQLGLKRRV